MLLVSWQVTAPHILWTTYITRRNEWYCLGVDIVDTESSWTAPSLCDRALSHCIWLGMLTGNAVGSWVSIGPPCVKPCAAREWAGWKREGGVVNQQQDAYWSWRPLVRFQFSYLTHCRWLALSLPRLFSLALRCFFISLSVDWSYGGFAAVSQIVCEPQLMLRSSVSAGSKKSTLF